MDPAALAGLCALLAHGAAAQPLPAGLVCPAVSAPAARVDAVVPPASSARRPQSALGGLAAPLAGADARDGIARVAYAEAGNQGDSGLAAVVYTILNRLQDGRWGDTVDSVLNAPHQFEPVMRAGGSWRQLRSVSDAQRARIDTIINLALEGRLPDLTNGARFFQNPRVVAARAADGEVSASLVDFGGAPPSDVIGAHSFYAGAGRGGARRGAAVVVSSARGASPDAVLEAAGGAIFVGENRSPQEPAIRAEPAADDETTTRSAAAASDDPSPGSGDPARAIFVLPDGRASANRR